jgi:hypothetical protein
MTANISSKVHVSFTRSAGAKGVSNSIASTRGCANSMAAKNPPTQPIIPIAPTS